ncbi:hypothetical protein D1013_04535 [Euzebyella marina]|uniref:Uncharacterized protein n=1 Tax=Euzebyella marina TaxID=1761453 RepID=A0A3G2L346_9FLAO|nr:hypothetical protein [Euzebyella marina]AYN66700.1 hypothetical protein D1013_04535 [Euzebyella marina]
MFKKIVLGFAFLVTIASCKKQISSSEGQTKVLTKNGEIKSISGTRQISGVYPHLTTYAHGRENGVYGYGNECGIGALAEWNDKLYMINYAAHQPKGSEHKLYIIDENLNMEVFEGSIGGTPTARMVHQESNQLLIGPYVIDSTGQIRVVPYSKMEGRLNAYARHLKDPENWVYMYDMEGMLYELNVNDLSVNKLYQDPLPGWHGKGGYTSQGRLVISNNGEHASEGRVTHDTQDWDNNDFQWEESWKVDKENIFGHDKLGILAEFDGKNFKVVERKQYTDITTKNGIYAIPNDDSPLWAIGWDAKSVRLKVLDAGKWYTYLLPKATYNNDPPHGWFTEWPRIRSIGNDKMMMDMHGMFFDFPKTFSASNTSGIRPIGSHLRYIPDFINWNGQLILATDETSIQGNPLAGQPQSNLWFGSYSQLSEWGPSSAYGAIWLKEDVQKNKPSDPFLISGFDNRMIHFRNYGNTSVELIIEIDIKGNNAWEELKVLTIPADGYVADIFDEGLDGEWIRLKSDIDAQLTASIHLTDDDLNDGVEGRSLFRDLVDIDDDSEVNHAKLYSNKTNFNLSIFNGAIVEGKFEPGNEWEFSKFDFKFQPGIQDTTAREALVLETIGKQVSFDNKKEESEENSNSSLPVWSEDAASIIINAKEYKLRLPKGKSDYKSILPAGTARFRREVESERELANVGGTFYELPLFKVGQEPRYKMMRPVSTHNKQITDFNTWNGLLVLSGVKKGALKSEHVYTNEDNSASIWLGGIDDLWKYGKPVGEGGPWKDSKVIAGEMSDLYLMTGYDKKTLELQADKKTKVTLYVHVNHYLDEAIPYKTFELQPNKKITYEFPDGFSAHWAQLKSDEDCKITSWFIYE